MTALRRYWWVIAVAAAALAAFLLLRGGAPAIAYETQPVERGDIVTSISASGKIQALNTVEIGSQVSGQITALYADFNTPVKEGQVLARIDPSTFTSRVEQGQAQAANAQAQAASARAQVTNAQAALVEAQRAYDTLKRLEPNGFVTRRSIETAEAALRQAQAGVTAARAGLTGAAAQTRSAQSALEQSRIDVTRTYIRAPVDGVIIDRTINLGQTVAASLQAPKLFVIAEDLSRMQVEAAVDEADIGRVKQGQRVEFTVDAYPEDTFRGTVSEVRVAGVELNSVVTYTVVIEAPNPDRKLLPGMTANAEIILGEVRNVLKVPAAALRYQPVSDEPAATPAQAGVGGPLSGGGGPGGPGGGGRRGRADPTALVDRLAGDLDLTADQRTKIVAIYERTAQQSRGGDRGARQKAREAQRQQIAALLTPEQRTRYDAMQPAGRGRGGGTAGARSGTVYIVGAEGEPERRFIRVTPGDDSFSAGVGGDLKAGEAVIVGETVPADPA